MELQIDQNGLGEVLNCCCCCCCTEKQTDCATSLLSPLSTSRLPVLFPAAPERTTDLSLCSRLPRPCILPLGLCLCLSSLHSMQIFMFVADSQRRERAKTLKQKVRVLQMKDSLTQWLKEDAANQATIKGFRCRNRNRN